MQNNSNRLVSDIRFFHDVSKPLQTVPNYSDPVPITGQTQQFTGSNSHTINSSAAHVNSNANNARPVLYYSNTPRQNIRPWMKTLYPSNQNQKLDSTESVVINLDAIDKPSTSNSVDFYQFHVNNNLPGHFQQNTSSAQSERVIEINSVNVENNSVQPHCNNSINNQVNVNAVTQNNEGTPEEDLEGNSRQTVEKFFSKYIPFVSFLSLKAVYDHREGILIFVAFLLTFTHANSVLKREISKQNRRSLFSLGTVFANLFISICFIYLVFREQHLYKNLIFIPPYSQPLNIWEVLWIVGVTDFIIKFITIQLKVGMACFPAKLLPYSARGNWYLTMECASQLYRSLVPIQPWLYYIMEVYQGPESFVGILFSIAYIVLKGSDALSKVKLFLKCVKKLFVKNSLGIRPTSEQLVSTGSYCPICHDEYNCPILLRCKHIFCDTCISTWFDREQTCPLCRAKISDEPPYRDGSTSFFMQLF